MQTNLEESFFVIKYDGESGTRGCPFLLKGELNHERFEWETTAPPPREFSPKEEYVFRAKHAVVDFDFNSSHHFIASERFCNLCESLGAKLIKVPLKIIQSNGAQTAKNYFYLLCLDWANVVDLSLSRVVLSRDLSSGEVIPSRLSPDRPDIEAIYSVEPLTSELKGRHFFRGIDMGGAFLCSAEFKSRAEDAKMLGCKFVALRDYQDIPFWLSQE